jgi:hypothetical protein
MNYDNYIGLPYKENGRDDSGIDCWGLARKFYKDELAIDLPSYVDLYTGSEDPVLPSTINYYKDSWSRVEHPQTGDLCLFKILGEPSHIGIYIGDAKFLHSREGKDSVIERLDNPKWFNRLEGYYRYTEKLSIIPVVGSPNPLQWNQLVEAAHEGTTAENFAKYISVKYKLSSEAQQRLILLVDGRVIPQSKWSTTYFTRDNVVNYKVVAQGRDGKRIALTLAVIVAAVVLGPEIAAYAYNAYYAGTAALAVESGLIVTAATAATVPTAWAMAATMAIQFAGMALVNAAFPIRPPKDLGQGTPTNSFTGAQNQANPFGGLPVVLGKSRVTGLLGAVPYNEPTERSSLLHLLIIWGFGPLYLDLNSLSIGSNKIGRLIAENSLTDKKFTLFGLDSETEAERKQFNGMYPVDVQQKPNSPVELYNDGSASVPWTWISFSQPATTIKLAINFPEGLRDIKASKGEEKEATVEFLVTKPIPHTFPDNPINGDTAVLGSVTYTWDNERGIWSTTATPAISGTIDAANYRLFENTSITLTPVESGYYRKTIISLKNGGSELVINQGHISTTQADPNLATRTITYNTSLSKPALTRMSTRTQEDLGISVLVDDQDTIIDAVTNPTYDTSYGWEPVVSDSDTTIWSYIQDSSGIISQQDLRTSHPGVIAEGLVSTYVGNTISITSGFFKPSNTAIGAGGATFTISPYDTSYQIFSTEQNTSVEKSFAGTVKVTSSGWKNYFLKDYAIWKATGNVPVSDRTIELQKTNVTFPLPGWYTVDFSVDNEGYVEIGKTTGTLQRVVSVANGQDDGGGWKDERVLNSNYTGLELKERITPINPIRSLYYVAPGEEGAFIVKVWAKNHEAYTTTDSSGNTDAGVALRIVYEYDGIVNINKANNGDYEAFSVTKLDKNGFNYIKEWTNLPRDTYTIGIKRLTPTDPRNGDWQRLWRTYLQTVTAYDSENNPPLLPLPTRNWYNDKTLVKDTRNLCRTAIAIQSSNRVNGNIEGINALLQTIALDYDSSINTTTAVSAGSFVLGREYIITTISGTNYTTIGATSNIVGSKFIATAAGSSNGTGTATPTGWKQVPTNNPASLFRYVLQHTANAFPVSDSEIDLIKLQEWWTFCNTTNSANGRPKLTYNNVLTNTQNLMEVLKDISAAGMASPTFINGKWSVVIDTIRPYTVQHFTPHNSWGFESTKLLPRIPNAFRISFPNEQLAYQTTETIVYDWGYGEKDGYEVTAGNFIVGQEYRITYLGNTNWVPLDLELAGENNTNWQYVGATFTAGAAGSGTGRAFSTANHTANGTTIKVVKAASQFESIQLPGVTNPNQVKFFGKWHLAQLHKRPERYTINVDFEYLICTRGDKVKVTHDIPLWGSGSARVKSISGNDIVLTESILFNISKSYQILIRVKPPLSPAMPNLNEIPTFKGNITPLQFNTVSNNWEPATSNNSYDRVRITSTISGNTASIEADDLCMIGEVDLVTQDLIVLTIEPGGNLTAKLTLADYAEDIYTEPLEDLNIAFDSKISYESLDIIKHVIYDKPLIVRINTDSVNSNEISPGIYSNNAMLSFANPGSLAEIATKVQFDYTYASSVFDRYATTNSFFTEKDTGTITIPGLQSNVMYKLRARYSSGDGTIFGPWTDEYIFYNGGYQVNEFKPASLTITLEGTNLIVRPVTTTGEVVPKAHSGYEFRLYKNSGDETEDFWNIDINPADKAANYLEQTASNTVIFDLLKLPTTIGVVTGSITGTTLTVTAISSGGVVKDGLLNGTGVLNDTFIQSQTLPLLTGETIGGIGRYTISTSHATAVSSGQLNILNRLIDDNPSSTGTKYRIACRAIDKTNNYSTSSTLGFINLRTIQPPTLTSGD